jgi:hypothetical protein
MKRTREVIFYSHPDQRWNLSGCTRFDGEDLQEEDRLRHNQQKQRDFLKQQIEEKEHAKALAKQQDK